MGANAYICLNGEFLKTTDPCLFTDNRAFRYADALQENIHAFSTEPQFLKYHLERLTGNMQMLSMIVPAFFTEETIAPLIIRLLNKNRIFGGAAIRLTVFRNSGETFLPVNHEISFLLESNPLRTDKYELNDRGLNIDLCNEYVKTSGPLSRLRNADSMLYLLAGIHAQNNNLDEVILLNDSGRILEAGMSNIFLVSGNAVFTPGIDQGCVPGIMRRFIIGLASRAGFRVNDQSSLTPAALEDAEEVFLTNAIEGLRWVGAYRQRRYYNKTAKQLAAKLNDVAFNG